MPVVRVAVDAALPPATGVTAVGGIADRVTDEAEVWSALVLGLRDYVGKNGFRSVVLGLSGGIDSAVVAAIAVDALGAEHVVGVSHAQRPLLRALPRRRGRPGQAHRAATTAVEPIQPMVDAFLANLSLSGLAVENLQARVRGVILMALSNQEGHLVLTTGNKSELAVGYSTLYGDSVGGFNPLKDVPKTLVWQLARWRNADAARRGAEPPIPENSIAKPPSAELRPGQLDTRLPAGLRRCWTRSSPATSTATWAAPTCSRPGTTRPWSTGCCGWSTSPSTSAASRRPAPRSPSRRSAATAGCRSPTGSGRCPHDGGVTSCTDP